MMRVVPALLLAASVSAQTTPNFSGRWILTPDPPGAGGGRGATAGSGWGSDITVTQDAATLTIEYAQYTRYDMQPLMKFVYRLDGSESKNTINMGRGPQEQISRVAWNGGKLVITTRHTFTPAPGGAAMSSETVHVLSLESPASLAIETTRGAVMGGEATTTKTIYKKN
jgi:hypothetical protein